MNTRERAKTRYKRRIDKRFDARVKRFWQGFMEYVKSSVATKEVGI